MNALILVDIQNDFIPGGALPVPEGDEIVALANRLQPHFDLVVATQDWHPADHASFAANHPGRKIYDEIELQGMPQTLWPSHCVQNTRGAEFVTGLDRTRWDRVFKKGTDRTIDSYSGFFDNSHSQATGLGDYLREKGVTDVYVCGLATDYCVKFTVLDALQLGFRTHLIEDASRGVSREAGGVAGAVADMQHAGANITTVQQVLDANSTAK